MRIKFNCCNLCGFVVHMHTLVCERTLRQLMCRTYNKIVFNINVVQRHPV